MSFTWTDEIFARALELRSKGESFAAIAAAIGCPTRNAVIGKLAREGHARIAPRADRQATNNGVGFARRIARAHSGAAACFWFRSNFVAADKRTRSPPRSILMRRLPHGRAARPVPLAAERSWTWLPVLRRSATRWLQLPPRERGIKWSSVISKFLGNNSISVETRDSLVRLGFVKGPRIGLFNSPVFASELSLTAQSARTLGQWLIAAADALDVE